MPRIKLTGYIDTDDLDPDQVDLGHDSGLSEKGHDDLLGPFGDGPGMKLSDLMDVDTVLED